MTADTAVAENATVGGDRDSKVKAADNTASARADSRRTLQRDLRAPRISMYDVWGFAEKMCASWS